jgi:FtsZ-binding cell division protein ZapB
VRELRDQCEEQEFQNEELRDKRAAAETAVRELRDQFEEEQHQNEELRDKHTATETTVRDLRGRFEEQKLQNEELREANRLLEGGLEALAGENQALGSELRSIKKALHDVHSAASRATKRLHSQYDKLANSGNEEDEKDKGQS